MAGAGGIEPPLRVESPSPNRLDDAPVDRRATPAPGARPTGQIARTAGPRWVRTAQHAQSARVTRRRICPRVIERPGEAEHGRPAARHQRSERARRQQGGLHAADHRQQCLGERLQVIPVSASATRASFRPRRAPGSSAGSRSPPRAQPAGTASYTAPGRERHPRVDQHQRVAAARVERLQHLTPAPSPPPGSCRGRTGRPCPSRAPRLGEPLRAATGAPRCGSARPAWPPRRSEPPPSPAATGMRLTSRIRAPRSMPAASRSSRAARTIKFRSSVGRSGLSLRRPSRVGASSTTTRSKRSTAWRTVATS